MGKVCVTNQGKKDRWRNWKKMRQSSTSEGTSRGMKKAPVAALSQQHPQRVTVRQTDRTPPKATSTSIQQTHRGACNVCLNRKQKTLRGQGH